MNIGGSFLDQARELLQLALDCGEDFSHFATVLEIKELLARLETDMARDKEKYELERAGASASQAYKIHRRSQHDWNKSVPVEHQDLILSALEKLSPESTNRDAIYQKAAATAPDSTPKATTPTRRSWCGRKTSASPRTRTTPLLSDASSSAIKTNTAVAPSPATRQQLTLLSSMP